MTQRTVLSRTQKD